MLPLTVAKRRPVSGVSMAAEAGVLGSIQGLAGRESVAIVTNVRERARIHQTGEPCCAAETQVAGEMLGGKTVKTLKCSHKALE